MARIFLEINLTSASLFYPCPHSLFRPLCLQPQKFYHLPFFLYIGDHFRVEQMGMTVKYHFLNLSLIFSFLILCILYKTPGLTTYTFHRANRCWYSSGRSPTRLTNNFLKKEMSSYPTAWAISPKGLLPCSSRHLAPSTRNC